MRIATIDIGTNTAQLLVADVTDGAVERVDAAERFVRLGEGVDASGRVGDAARARLFDTLRTYDQRLRDHGAERVAVAGTSALRDATNRTAVLEAIRSEFGWTVDVLAGDEEAAWSFAAACSAFGDLSGPCLVVDIGGGSTELIAGTNPAAHHPHYPDAITGRASLDIGCVRLTERCFDAQPPSAAAVARAEQVIDDALAGTSFAVGPAPTLIGTAGTATALALVHAGPGSTADALRGEGVVLSRANVRHWRDALLDRTVDEIRALHPEAMDGRADVFAVGVILLDRVLRHFDRDTVRVSPYELRHGLALRALAQ